MALKCLKLSGLLVLISFVIGGCFMTGSGGVSNLKWTSLPNTPTNLKPNTGHIHVIWAGHTPVNLNKKSYKLIGRVSGRSRWCGRVAPIDNEELHAAMIDEAKSHGGNGIFFRKCGFGGMGSESVCYCYAEVVLYNK